MNSVVFASSTSVRNTRLASADTETRWILESDTMRVAPGSSVRHLLEASYGKGKRDVAAGRVYKFSDVEELIKSLKTP